MKSFIYQPFHLVTISPWPIITSFSLMNLTMSMITMFNNKLNYMMFSISILLILLCSFQWWRDIYRESTLQGMHSIKTKNGLKLSMILFIASEILFFISFFWSYFHMMLSPSIDIGIEWPPYSLKSFLIDPYSLPLLNTIILISSGMFLSMAHYLLIMKNMYATNFLIIITLILGMIFTWIQMTEYFNSTYSIFNSNFGATFFMMTGFHGIHVIIGTMFILIMFIMMNKNYLSNYHHLSFELSAWYWHFVDVVWLFLFIFIYWWPY
uniref:Cytochrome c oxidase subunit 3 n=1 Tax=Scelio sp. ZJUH_2016028 TaxID=2496283 RepID=A0A3Q8UAC6_9HYME|nr:cytochrome c oxidase subunit 3 [Scelio sp. ZJUH_2016028]